MCVFAVFLDAAADVSALAKDRVCGLVAREHAVAATALALVMVDEVVLLCYFVEGVTRHGVVRVVFVLPNTFTCPALDRDAHLLISEFLELCILDGCVGRLEWMTRSIAEIGNADNVVTDFLCQELGLGCLGHVGCVNLQKSD